jgi:transposase
MCGICGIVSKPGRADDLDRAVLAMVDRLSHRGPDGRGVLTLGPPAMKRPVTLGHTRLAIIDLSDAGRQPMSSDDGRVHLILNGEVYNHRRLRDGLTKRGYRFRSTCDTEVVLRLYEERGPASIAELDGMFALAVIDTSRQILLLARDPLGIKPLYYDEGEQGLVFGSEIKAILASGLYRTEVEWQGIWDYFTYLYVPCPHTAYRGVRQLPPAHLLEQDSRIDRGMIQDGKLRGFAMGHAIPVRTDYTAGEVRRFARRAKDAAQARRLLAIAAVLEGASREEAANIGGMDRQTLRDWLIRFNEQGANGLINIPSPGMPPKLNATHKAFLVRIVEEGPIAAIHGVVRWRACDLIMRLHQEFGLSVSDDTIYRALKTLGFSHVSARPKAYKQNAEAMEAFKKTSPSVWRKSARSSHPTHR